MAARSCSTNPWSKPPTKRVRHGQAAGQLRELVQGEQVEIPEQEQAGHDAGDHNQIAVALCLLRRPAGGRIDHRREMVLGDRRVGAVLLDPLRGCLGHGSIIARPAHRSRRRLPGAAPLFTASGRR